MAKKSFDAGLFSDITSKCTEREQLHAQRISMCNAIEKMFLMEWEDEKPSTTGKEWIKLTISPEARNKAIGAIRLMTATDPKFSVPFDKNSQDGKDKSSKLEKAASAMWSVAGRIRQNPVHYDAISSAVLFGEIHIGVNSTADLLEHAKGSSKANIKRFEKIAAMTPYLPEVYDPRTGFPEFDDYGLSSFYRKVKMKSGAVLDAWGESAIASGMNVNERFEDVDYCDYWDSIYHIAWIDGNSTPLLFAEHNLPCIPIVAQITDGSTIHAKEEYKRQPFLYTLWKSGLWKRQNLAMTVMYSTMFALASNPTFVEKVQSEDRDIHADYSTPGGKIKMLVNEDFAPLAKNAIDPSITQSMEFARQQIEDSTIFSQTLGQPLGSNAPYSMVALLNQAGRLPLVTIQKRGSWAISKAMELAFMMMKEQSGNSKVQGADQIIELSSADIPDNFIIDAKLDIELPQDQKQQIQLAIAGIQAGFFSKEFGRREFAGIEQSDDMEAEIWAEKMAELEVQKEYQKELAKVQLEIQQQAQQSQMAAQQQGAMNQMQNQPQIGGNQQAMMQQLAAQQQAGQNDQLAKLVAQRGATSGNPLTEPQQLEGA